MQSAQAKFLTGSLFRHVTVMSLTSSIGLMAVFFVDLVDMIFISMLGQAELAAAVGYAGAILFFTTSFSIGVAIAVGALVARALGAGDSELAQRRATHGTGLGVALGIIFVSVVWSYLPLLVELIGATGETADLAEGYLRIILPSLPLMAIGMIGGAILRAYGDAKRAMMTTIFAGVVNAVLDPIFIFGLGLDLTGAALASVASRITMAGAALYAILRYHQALTRPSVTGMIADTGPILAIGVPAILTQLATPVGQAIVTRSMAQYGQEAVAGMAIVARLMPVSFGVIFALSGAVGPILGQNFGANEHDRVRSGFNAALWFCGIVIAAISVALFLMRGFIADLFGATGVTRDLVYLFCGPLALLFFFNGVLFVANAAFNNLGHPFYSTLMNWGRNTVAMVPMVWLGALALDAQGVLIGQALSAVVFGGLAWWLAIRVMAEGGQRKERAAFARDGRILALFNLRR